MTPKRDLRLRFATKLYTVILSLTKTYLSLKNLSNILDLPSRTKFFVQLHLGTPTSELVNREKSIIDLCLTNSLDSVVNFEIYQMPLGVNSQTCHKPLILNILLAPTHARTNDNIFSKKKLVFPNASIKDRMKITKYVSSRFSSLRRDGISPDYQLLKEIFLTAKHRFPKRRSGKDKTHKKSYVTHRKSPATVLLQRHFRDAINNMREKSNFSVFVADHLEKLLYAQHRKRKLLNLINRLLE